MNPTRKRVLKRSQNILLFIGVAMLVSSSLLLLSMLSGSINMPENIIAGETTVHSIVRVAVVGCLLAAIGSFD